MKNYFILASKNLKRKKVRSWLTLIGIFIGIAAVVSLISLGNTLKAAVNSQFDVGSLDIIKVNSGGIGFVEGSSSKPLLNSDAEAIENIYSVEYALPEYSRTGKIEFNNKILFRSITSVPDSKRINNFYRELDISAEYGRLLKEGEKNKVIVGKNIADGKKNGFEKDLRLGSKIFINDKEFRITGILEGKGNFMKDYIILINEGQLKEMYDIGNEVDSISVKVRASNLVDSTKEEIEKLMRNRRNVKEGEEDFQISTPQSTLDSINQILMGIQIFIVIIASISIIVGAIGIANTMTTSIIERRKEIGTMKAIGAKNKNIFYQFFVESGLLGLIGGIIGVILGIVISYIGAISLNNFMGLNTKVKLDFSLILFTLVGSFFIGAISGIIPSMKAAKENPVEAIRG